MEHHAPESASDLEREKNQTEPQADGDSNGSNDSGGSNDSSGSETTGGETAADEAIVDGRLSGLPPNYDTDQVVDGEDSPALDAEIQSEQRHDSEEG
ncbi:hypothetical protein [Tunturiibacter empetritectus]